MVQKLKAYIQAGAYNSSIGGQGMIVREKIRRKFYITFFRLNFFEASFSRKSMLKFDQLTGESRCLLHADFDETLQKCSLYLPKNLAVIRSCPFFTL